MRGLPSFVVASPEGLWVYSLQWNVETLVRYITFEELADKRNEEEVRQKLLHLRAST